MGTIFHRLSIKRFSTALREAISEPLPNLNTKGFLPVRRDPGPRTREYL